MNGHDPHGIFFLAKQIYFSQIFLLPAELLYITDKLVQSPVSHLIISTGLFHKVIHIGNPLYSLGHRADLVINPGFIVDILQDLSGRSIGNLAPESGQHIQKLLDMLIYPIRLIVLPHCIIKAAVFVPEADFCHFFLRKVKGRAHQNPCQRHIHQWIVNDLHHLVQNLYLSGVKKSLVMFHYYRNPMFRQYIIYLLSVFSDTSHKDHDIPVLCRSVAVFFVNDLHRILGIHYILNISKCQIPFIFSLQCHSFFGPSQSQHHFSLSGKTPFFRWFKRRSRHQPGIQIILHASDVPMHHIFKDLIAALQHRIPASEVIMKVYPVSRRLFSMISVHFFYKQFRTGISEPVNTLFHISYHKQIGRIGC